jgi:hypothetical protein
MLINEIEMIFKGIYVQDLINEAIIKLSKLLTLKSVICFINPLNGREQSRNI